MSDSSSICSSHSATSVSLMKIECPYCQKELQARAMFNHIRKMHYSDFLRKTNRRFIEEAENKKPLKLYWTKTNDFDEEDEIILYACLASNKTFTSEVKANAHFANDKKLLKEHSKQMKDVKKDYLEMKKQDTKKWKPSEGYLRFLEAKKNNDPHLARCFWKGILHHCRVIDVCQFLCDKRKYKPETQMYILKPKGYAGRREDYQETSYESFLARQAALLARVEKAKREQCLDVKTLESLHFDCWTWWTNNYRESIVDFHNSLLDAMPEYWPETTSECFSIANEAMPGVEF